MDTNNNTNTQQFANDVNTAYPLMEGAANNSPAWDTVQGRELKEYYSRSPYCTVTAYEKGFVVENLVVGSKHPVATWDAAMVVRGGIVARYTTISAGCRY